MTAHPMDMLKLENGASLIFTACPGTQGVSVKDSLAQLKDAGAKAVVSLTPDSELQKLKATELGKYCEQLKLAWFQVPIYDDAGPESAFFDAWQQHKSTLIGLLRQGNTLAVHCRGGAGRTGLMIALLLCELGYNKEQVKEMVQGVRPSALTNPARLAFFNRFIAGDE